MKINEKILNFLTNQHVNLSELAQKVDMDYSNFHKMLKGKRKMPIHILEKIKSEYPALDLNYVFSDFEDDKMSIVAEEQADYFAENQYRTKLLEIKKILDATRF